MGSWIKNRTWYRPSYVLTGTAIVDDYAVSCAVGSVACGALHRFRGKFVVIFYVLSETLETIGSNPN